MKINSKRKVTNEDLLKYEPMVEMWIRNSVVKNWNEASTIKYNDEISLGNTGLTISDIRQFLRMHVCVALQKYNPDFCAENGKPIKESTFVYKHLWYRIGQKMNELTDKKRGYGIWRQNLEETFYENYSEK